MTRQRHIAVRNEHCLKCSFCEQFIECAAPETGCIGCGACVVACPQKARQLKPRASKGPEIRFSVNQKAFTTKGPISVWAALNELEKQNRAHGPEGGYPEALCETGGCWHCAVLIDGVLNRSCITPLVQGMEIVTTPEKVRAARPRRIVTLMRPAPHYHPSIFTHGCNYRCDLCHNWELTFSSSGQALTPSETVSNLKPDPENDYWIGISGGEPTLNRPWLVETVRKLRGQLPKSRIQLDTNASFLTPGYIDQLVEAGITDVSPDLKAHSLETFLKICGLQSEKKARAYLENTWNAITYLDAEHSDSVFMAVSLPCHPRIHTQTELYNMAAALSAVNPEIPVTLIEYQPAFRLRDWPRLSPKLMAQALEIVKSAGLKRVIVQGGEGIPRAVDPLELVLSSED